MAVSYCQNCHQALAPNDDICEHCGAVLTASPAPTLTSSPVLTAVAPMSSGATTVCPNCRQGVNPGDDICENCGAVLGGFAGSSTTAPPGSIAAPAVVTGGQKAVGICPNCQQRVNPGDDICENCGAVLSSITGTTSQPVIGSSSPLVSGAVACPRCQAPRAAHVKFCNRCGYRYTDASITLPPGAVAPAGGQTSELVAGSILHGKYHITSTIGAGGMGAVYLAEDQVLKRHVVIKALLSDDDAELAAQSVKEREFLATIKHASIVSIYDFITIGTRGYIVMEYVHGKTLDQIIEERGRTFDVPTAIRYMLGIIPAFTYLAKLGLVYCDFKPQNVMVERLKDDSEVVKLIDLGTVIRHEPKPGAVYGTDGFYAREAVKHPSPQTDLYSICRTLAYLVTLMDPARPLFGMPDQQEYQVFQEYPALYRLLVKGTHSRPERRFQSASELAEQLQGVLRMTEGGKPGEPVTSALFVSGMLTTTGKLGLRGQAALDEHDKAIDALRHGDLSLRSGSYASAIGFYKQAQVINRDSVDARLRLAEIYIDTGEYSLALAEITQVQRQVANSWKVGWNMGRLLEAQENYEEAARQYQELLNDLPGELPPQQALARVYARQGKQREAANLYASVLKADPGNTEACLGMADALIALQQWDEAARVLAGVNEAAARYVDAQLLLCDLYLNRMQPLSEQNVEQAVRALEKLADRTEDARYFLMRGEAYRAAWRLVRERLRAGQPITITLPGMAVVNMGLLRKQSEQNYQRYIRRAHKIADRETIIRRKLEVAPWRMW